MTATQDLIRHSALRLLMKAKSPDRWRQQCEIWQAWINCRQAELPDADAPRVYVTVPIKCIDDIPLYVGLLQLLQVPGLLPVLVFVLPNRVGARLALAEAMRAGWGGLVTISTEADWQATLKRLPRSARLVQFHCPAGFDATGSDFSSVSALDNLTDLSKPAGGAWSGLASEWDAKEYAPALPDLTAHFRALTEIAISIDPPVAEGCPKRPQECSTEPLLRPHSMLLPSVSEEDLIAVTTNNDDGQSTVIALKPAVLSNPSGLTIPLPARFTTLNERQLDIHLLRVEGSAHKFSVTALMPPTEIQPWMLSAYLNRGGAGNPVVSAFARGTGCRLAYAEDELAETEVLHSIPVVWGVLRGSNEIIERAKAQSLNFYYIDHAYFNRGHGNSYRITRNGYEAGPVRKCTADRFKKLDVSIEPWRRSGRSIIVCPPTDFFAAAHGCENWLEETLTQLRLETDRPIVVRAKPQAGEKSVPLREALRDAHALVTHSSNVAIEAACLGTPVFVSPTSAAAPIGWTDIGKIETPRYPTRDGWLAHLAWSQFTFEEFANGEAWRNIQMHEGRDYV